MSDSLSVMREDWNRRAREDAYYYVAFVNPHQAEDGFHGSAAEVIRELEGEFHRLDALGTGLARRRALEIGCGPGRLLLPISSHFEEIYGVDISEEMIRIARERLRGVPHAHLMVNSGGDLALFEDNYFSFVYSYIVFQHIPDKQIVLNYLHEIQRVLVTGGVTRFQVRGVPPSNAGLQESITWKGCVVQDSEIVEFAQAAGMELVAMSGEETQYLWVTLRKRPRPALHAVTSSSSSATQVPQRGPGAAISLWIRDTPIGADLTTLSAHVGGQAVRGSYLSPIASDGGCQMNVTLPRNVAAGVVEVALVYQHELLHPALSITIEPALLVPRVVGICDAKNIAMELRSESGGLKVLIEDLEDPGTMEFQLAGIDVTDVDITCTNKVLNQFLFSWLLPHGVRNGLQTLEVYYSGRVLYHAEVAIRKPLEAPQIAVLDAVTAAASGSTSVPQSGPGAAISLWIRNAPAGADLYTLSARVNGTVVPGSFLSAISPEGGCQMNVMLPVDVPTGSVAVELVQDGEVLEPKRIIHVEAVVPVTEPEA
jgi:ubiquinone/menaquinone biosynthesis C-methylase UbiE